MSSRDLMDLITKVLKTQDVITHLTTGKTADEDIPFLVDLETKLPILQDALSAMIADENVVAANRELVELVKRIRLQEGIVAQADAARDQSMNAAANNSIIARLEKEFSQKKRHLEDLRKEIRQHITHAQIMARGGEQLDNLKNLLRQEVGLKCAACEAARLRLAEVDPPLAAAAVPAPAPAPSPSPAKKGWFGRGGRKTRRHKKRRNRQTRSRR